MLTAAGGCTEAGVGTVAGEGTPQTGRFSAPRLCERRSCRIKGSSYAWFKKALDRGDLATVRSELSDLPPLTLEDALSVALLICEHEPENAERAAVRWLRKLLERPGLTLAELRRP